LFSNAPDARTTIVLDGSTSKVFADALRRAPEVRSALAAVLGKRDSQMTAAELLEVVQLTRRYSFNRYQ
jgi:hypothetical protein